MKSIFRGLKATCDTKCNETPQTSRCWFKPRVQQIGVIANNTNSMSREMVGPQNVDYLNCTKIVLFSFKNKKRMPVNARSLPEFSVHPSDVTFSYLKEKKYFFNKQYSRTRYIASFSSLHIILQTYSLKDSFSH